MANNVWSSLGSTDGNLAGNWSLGHVPTIGEVAYFDATSVVNCTFTAGLICDGIEATAAYSGSLDLGGGFTHAIGSDGVVLDHAGNVDLGSSAISCSGDWDDVDVGGSWTYGTAVVTLSGTGKTYTSKSTHRIASLVVSGTIAQVGGGTINGLEVTGSLTVATLSVKGPTTVATGTLAGTTLGLSNFNIVITGGGTWSVATTTAYYNPTINAGTYGGAWTILHTAAGGGPANAVTIGGNITWTGSVTFLANAAGVTYTVDNSGNHDLTFQGDVTCSETTGTMAWTAGTGTITFSGTNDQAVNFLGLTVEAIVIDKTAGTVTLSATLTCGALTGTDGDLDINGQTLTASGAVSFASGFTVADLVGSTIACDTFSADGQTLGSTGGYSSDVPAALGSGQSYEFDGVDDYISIKGGDTNIFEGDAAFSVACWVKLNNTGVDCAAVDKYWDGSNRSWRLNWDTSANRWEFQCATDTTANPSDVGKIITPDNSWHHLVGTWSAVDGTQRFYFDNTAGTTAPAAGNTVRANDSPVWLGRSWYNNIKIWGLPGLLDDVRIFNKQLSVAEVEYLYTNGVSGDDPGTANLQAHWKFDGDLLDETANNNDGTVYGQQWYLNATTSGTISNATISNCDASGGVEIDASDGTCVDGGGNSNINFGAVVVPPHLFPGAAA